MKKSVLIKYILFFFIVITLNSCVNLKQVNEFSKVSLRSLSEFENISYSFSKSCKEMWMYDSIVTAEEFYKKIECDCDEYKVADSITLVLYNSIKAYFVNLEKISDNDITTYNFNNLKDTLINGNYKNFEINKEQADAYSKIAGILSRATTDIYRKNKIKKYIGEANEPLSTLLVKFKFIVHQNLKLMLQYEKESLYGFYSFQMKVKGINEYEKNQIQLDYFKELMNIELVQKQIDVYASNLDNLIKGHQKLYEGRDKLNSIELKAELITYTSYMESIISEINKLKK